MNQVIMKVSMKEVTLSMTVIVQFLMDLVVVKVILILMIPYMTATNPVTQAPDLVKLTQTSWSQVTESENGHFDNGQIFSLIVQ